jgi:hypothetical protein
MHSQIYPRTPTSSGACAERSDANCDASREALGNGGAGRIHCWTSKLEGDTQKVSVQDWFRGKTRVVEVANAATGRDLSGEGSSRPAKGAPTWNLGPGTMNTTGMTPTPSSGPVLVVADMWRAPLRVVLRVFLRNVGKPLESVYACACHQAQGGAKHHACLETQK